MDKSTLPVFASPPPSKPTSRVLKLKAIVLCTLLGLVCYRSIPLSPHTGIGGNPAFLVKARNGAVATENVLCSDIGVDILKAGGNAVDAAVATTFCIGTLNMFSSGIGGGGFMTVRIPPKNPGENSEVFFLDFRETGPALANNTMYPPNSNTSLYGGLAVGVPGEIRGLQVAHDRWGTLPWETLVFPSINLARGWKMQNELAKRITWYPDLMLSNPDWSSVFAPNGRFLEEGEIISRTNYSRTLEAIASGGPDAFYKGPIADALINKIRATGGILSHADLENYTVKVERALEGTYRGRKIHTSHAPASGPVLLHMLNLVENFDMSKRTPVNMHRAVEALKFGFAARTKISDPAFNNDAGRIDEISTKAFADLIARNITDDQTHPPSYYNPIYDVPLDHGTSHTSVVDKDGMAVSLTSTINTIFGSQVLDPVTGVIMNNEMNDFNIPNQRSWGGMLPSPYNYPDAGKRPLSSITPTIIENADGSLATVVGGSGGSRIFGAVFQVLLNLDFGLDASEAVEAPRLHNQLYPEIVEVDPGYAPDVLAGLSARGHGLAAMPRVAAVVQAVVQQPDGQIFAASDSRKNGIAAGY
ncbi:gamma-glutamyltranspeptidase [Roridomyces roridus]|uniref:Glutathione hydrolase n=1 Tax=Roridomyces roridus TaxID=1738132 RepID=A0AAD7CFM1_9AGAR|nr:gamma-glutamyltranspeptidase [Roridomyces roridus]